MGNESACLLLDKKTHSVVEKYLPERHKAADLSELFFAFSDCTRIRILSALTISEMCVTDLARVLKMNQTTLSHQLKILRDMGIVRTKRQGKIIFYRVTDTVVANLLSSGIEFLGY